MFVHAEKLYVGHLPIPYTPPPYHTIPHSCMLQFTPSLHFALSLHRSAWFRAFTVLPSPDIKQNWTKVMQRSLNPGSRFLRKLYLKHHRGKISQKLCFTLMKLYIELLWYLLKHKIVKYFVFFPWRYLTCIRAWHPIHILKFQNAHQTYFEIAKLKFDLTSCLFTKQV